MENIYGQDDALTRNSIADIPSGYAEDAGNTLYSWLGSLWRSIHQGDDMVRGLQKSRGMLLAQLYLDLLETAKLQDRNGVPVFHRELWHPIVIRRSQRDKAQENMLVMGVEAKLGPQTEQQPYGIGTVLKMGRLANYADFVTYPITKNIVGMSTTIVDNIINPTVVMHYDNGDGTGDFEFRNNSIIFPKELDPLAANSAFDKYDLPNLTLEDPQDPTSPMISDVEAVLWASDVLIDKNYIAEHLSYPLGVDAPSSDVVKRIINAAWSSIASGLTPELLRTFMAAMLNIPVIQHDQETIVDINSSSDAQVVYTDKGMYRVSPKATLRKGLHAGSVLSKGDLLDESLRIYPFLSKYITDISSIGHDFDTTGQQYEGVWGKGRSGAIWWSNYPAEGLGVDSDEVWLSALEFIPATAEPKQELYARIFLDDDSVVVSEKSVWAGGVPAVFHFQNGVRLIRGDQDIPRYYHVDLASSPQADSAEVRLKVRNTMIQTGAIFRRVVTPVFRTVVSSHSPIDVGFSVPVQQDIPSVIMPPSVLRVRTQYGIYAVWGEVEVKAADDNPAHLYFDLGGINEDTAAFWQETWRNAEQAGVSMASILGGGVGAMISPVRFFLKNFVGANTIFVVIDRSQLEDISLVRDPMFFGMLSSVVPSAVRLFLVEHRAVGDDDKMELETATEDTFLAATLPEVVEHVSAPQIPGQKVDGAYFEDRVMMKFVRPAPEKVRIRKEEV